eukprot:gnl/Chilomastix_cuspidata/1849.p1 GENE.gnl/Chilomastix_cuspidata/1849~~gnl/Chilomastix_cuspidata/1849.p1  ORF type:complete len:253 (-),score=86.78 gnl/Chilomastix_cuspidata/1849:168-926(-)
MQPTAISSDSPRLNTKKAEIVNLEELIKKKVNQKAIHTAACVSATNLLGAYKNKKLNILSEIEGLRARLKQKEAEQKEIERKAKDVALKLDAASRRANELRQEIEALRRRARDVADSEQEQTEISDLEKQFEARFGRCGFRPAGMQPRTLPAVARAAPSGTIRVRADLPPTCAPAREQSILCRLAARSLGPKPPADTARVKKSRSPTPSPPPPESVSDAAPVSSSYELSFSSSQLTPSPKRSPAKARGADGA